MNTLVVCPTYGRIPFLNRMFASFLSQTYDDKHLVIVNDDENVEICCDYDRVTCINLNRKILLPQKRNIGVSVGYADLILQHDDDDIFLPDRISNHVNKHLEYPNIWMYRNDASYIIYGDKFKLESNSPNTASYLRSAWYAVGGYAHHQNIAEDQEFYYKMGHKMVERDESKTDYVYNWGGVNYHMSFEKDITVEEKAFNQLKELNLLDKKYYIEPDFDEYEKFKRLDAEYRRVKHDLDVQHVELGKIEINV